MKASVKVMRSHDYCHFEVILEQEMDRHEVKQLGVMLYETDQLRKEAARLVDKAVDQYKIHKRNAELRQTDEYARSRNVEYAAGIRLIPEPERTVRQQAELKAFDDRAYVARRQYDYEDEWEEKKDWNPSNE
jgi:hypothetical protein